MVPSSPLSRRVCHALRALVEVAPERFPDLISRGRARLVRILAVIIAPMDLLFVPFILAAHAPLSQRIRDALTAAVCATFLGTLYALAGRGPRGAAVAGWVFIPLFLFAMVAGAAQGRGIVDINVFGLWGATVLGGLLLGATGVVVSAAAAIAGLLVLGGLTAAGRVTSQVPPLQGFALWDRVGATALVVIFTAAMLIVLERLYQRLLRSAVKHKRAHEHEHARARALDERTKLQARLARLVVHEVRNPLAAVKGNVQLLRRQMRDGLAVSPAVVLERMERGTERIERLMSDLLDMAQIESGHLAVRRQPCELRAICRAAAEDLEAASGRGVASCLPEGPVTVAGDPQRLGQVLTNLLANADSFSPEGAKVGLSLEVRGDRAVIAVRDHGPGIAPAEQERIFDAFYRLAQDPSRRGLGLGLFLCRQLTEQHGGRVRVESAPPDGSTFYVELPLLSLG